MQGEQPEYVQGLQFDVQTASAAADPDEEFQESGQVAASDTSAAPQSQAAGGESGGGTASISAAELTGKDLLSADGEVVWEVMGVRFSDQHGEEVAAVELNGFLGIGGSQIELPLSKLSMAADGDVQTTMTDEELESMPEVGEEGEEM